LLWCKKVPLVKLNGVETEVSGLIRDGNSTGAGVGGIGFALAKRLANDYGMHLVLADNSSASLEAARTELVQAGRGKSEVLAVQTDVGDLDSVKKLADEAFGKFGKVDVLVLNAVRCRGEFVICRSMG
jgi:NAD(P)-dependent dehydrogenase (short-subunit alcohol dehydrogenase family)